MKVKTLSVSHLKLSVPALLVLRLRLVMVRIMKATVKAVVRHGVSAIRQMRSPMREKDCKSDILGHNL